MHVLHLADSEYWLVLLILDCVLKLSMFEGLLKIRHLKRNHEGPACINEIVNQMKKGCYIASLLRQ